MKVERKYVPTPEEKKENDEKKLAKQRDEFVQRMTSFTMQNAARKRMMSQQGHSNKPLRKSGRGR